MNLVSNEVVEKSMYLRHLRRRLQAGTLALQSLLHLI